MSIPKTQRAIEVHTLRQPMVLVTDRPVLQPGPRQVLVKVTVAGVNPTDQGSRDDGRFIADRLPAVIGNDVVGKVVQLGAEVSELKISDRVVGQSSFEKDSPQNSLQEYVLLDVDLVSRVPAKVSDDEAATLPSNAIPAWVGFFDSKNSFGWTPPLDGKNSATGELSKQTMLVLGGGSNTGRFAVQLASWAGVGQIVTLGGDEAELKGFGATKVLNRSGTISEVADRLAKEFPSGADYVFDAINAPDTQYLGINTTKKGGKYARLRLRTPPETTHIKEGHSYDLVSVFGSSHAVPVVSKVFWQNLPKLLEDGAIKPTKFSTIKGLDVDKINQVLDDYRNGKKVVKAQIHLE